MFLLPPNLRQLLLTRRYKLVYRNIQLNVKSANPFCIGCHWQSFYGLWMLEIHVIHLKKIKISCKKNWAQYFADINQIAWFCMWLHIFLMRFINNRSLWASLEERSVKTLISWTFFGVLDISHHTMLGLMIFCFKYYLAVPKTQKNGYPFRH